MLIGIFIYALINIILHAALYLSQKQLLQQCHIIVITLLAQ